MLFTEKPLGVADTTRVRVDLKIMINLSKS